MSETTGLIKGGSDGGRRLTVEKVTKRYGIDVPAVRNVSFSVEPGEFLTLLGPSGSGKTSVLMMVAGFENPTEGAIKLDGIDMMGYSPQKRELGVVFQGYALFPHMTVLENVEFPLRMRRQSKQERRRKACTMLERMGLQDFLTRRPRELSGGQQQRVALARALVFEPNALLLDEPLGALDKNLRESMQYEIKEIQKRQNVSVLFVTHDQEEAMRMSDRIAVMENGRIVQIGAPSEVYLRPSTAFVANFLGETNQLRCRICEINGSHAAVEYAGGHIGLASLPPHSGLSVHDQASVSIRPEQVQILDDGVNSEFSVEGTVTEQVFLGKSTRLLIDSLGTKMIVTSSDSRFANWNAIGSCIRLTWSKDDARILSTE